jgi:hypothetical protein
MSKNGLFAKQEPKQCEGKKPSYHKDSALIARTIEDIGICYFLANALMYFVSRNSKNQKIKEINKAITYLRRLDYHKAEPKPNIWNEYPAYCVGSTFKGLSEVVQCEHAPEDIEKALNCLFILSDFIQDKYEKF